MDTQFTTKARHPLTRAGHGRHGGQPPAACQKLNLRPAEAEELRAVRGWKAHRLVCAVIGGARGIRDPACRGRQHPGLFQRETGRVSRWPGNHYIRAGAKH